MLISASPFSWHGNWGALFGFGGHSEAKPQPEEVMQLQYYTVAQLGECQ
jgi:hypothetical protein